MLYAKFQDHRTLVSGEVLFFKNLAINGPCSHLGHVTKTIFRKQYVPSSKGGFGK